MSEMNTNKEVRDSIRAKLERFYGVPSDNATHNPNAKYGSYAEAKEAGDVTEMIGYKMADARAKAGKKDIIALSNKYASTMSITDIQGRIPSAETLMKKAKSIVERMYDAELDRVTKHYQKTIGGLQQEDFARAKAREAVDEWAGGNEEYQKAMADYLDAKREYTALCNAKDIFIEDHKDLIEAERARAVRRDILSSGILEEMGITPSEE